MLRLVRMLTCVVAVPALLLCSCTTGNSGFEPVTENPALQAAGTLPSLPAPVDMPRGGSGTDQHDRMAWCSDYLKAPWLHNLIDEEPWMYIRFLPLSEEGEPGSLVQTAYCTYHFLLPDFDNEPRIRLRTYSRWGGPQVWLGLADFETNRWDWHAVDESYEVELASIEPYLDEPGNLFVVVAVSGEEYSELELQWVIVGGNMLPSAFPVGGPRSGSAPLTVEFYPIADHADPDGHLVYFEWDFTGDGIYDYGGGNESATWNQTYTYYTPGEYHPVLRVTDNDGGTATGSIEVIVTES